MSLTHPKLPLSLLRSARLSAPGFLLLHLMTSGGHARAQPTEGLPPRISTRIWSRRRKLWTPPSSFCSITSPSRDREILHWVSLILDLTFPRRYNHWLLHHS